MAADPIVAAPSRPAPMIRPVPTGAATVAPATTAALTPTLVNVLAV